MVLFYYFSGYFSYSQWYCAGIDNRLTWKFELYEENNVYSHYSFVFLLLVSLFTFDIDPFICILVSHSYATSSYFYHHCWQASLNTYSLTHDSSSFYSITVWFPPLFRFVFYYTRWPSFYPCFHQPGHLDTLYSKMSQVSNAWSMIPYDELNYRLKYKQTRSFLIYVILSLNQTLLCLHPQA